VPSVEYKDSGALKPQLKGTCTASIDSVDAAEGPETSRAVRNAKASSAPQNMKHHTACEHHEGGARCLESGGQCFSFG
jgi:hypothetical protein